VLAPMDSVGPVRYRNEFWSVSKEKLRPGQRVRIIVSRGYNLSSVLARKRGRRLVVALVLKEM